MSPAPRHSELDLSLAVTSLVRGVVDSAAQPLVWRHVQGLASAVRDHVAVLGLTLEIDEAEGYAYLRSLPDDEVEPPAPGLPAAPRLVRRHALPFYPSLLLALLRGRLAEFDATSSETRLVLTREQIVEMVRVFLPESTNEVKVVDQVDGAVRRAVDLGFLQQLRGGDESYEVKRILKAFVDAQWLSDLDARLAAYAAHARGDGASTAAQEVP